MMDKIRLILIFLHVLITIFLIYYLHPDLSHVANSSENKKQISLIIGFVNNLIRISFYHSSCIIAIWYSRRYAAGIIRTTGILLIGEFLEIITIAIQHGVETYRITTGEIFLDVICVWIFLVAIVITFRLAKRISKHQKDLMQIELLTTTVSESSIDGEEEFSLV